MKSYRTLALKELLSQKVTSILILIAVVLSTMMTTIVGQSIGVLSAMREQQAIAIGGNRYATFLQMNADQLHALEQDERLSYVGKSIYMGSLELSPSLTLGLMEYLDDTAAIYPSSTSIEEGRLPKASMEIALSEDILKYLGFEGDIGDKITLSLQKNLRHNIADSYSYTAEFVLTGILKNNYLGYTSGTVTGVVGEGTAEQLLPESYISYFSCLIVIFGATLFRLFSGFLRFLCCLLSILLCLFFSCVLLLLLCSHNIPHSACQAYGRVGTTNDTCH